MNDYQFKEIVRYDFIDLHQSPLHIEKKSKHPNLEKEFVYKYNSKEEIEKLRYLSNDMEFVSSV
jgi:hypothetical protein